MHDHCLTAPRRLPGRQPRWRVLAAGFLVLTTCAAVALPLATSHAGASSGWNIVNAPATSDGGDDFILGTACANSQECWAVGIDAPNAGSHPIVQEWNGSSWSFVRTANVPNGGLFGVTCVSPSNCWAVGGQQFSAGAAVPLAEHWDGSSWTAMGTPNEPGAAGAILHSVSCVSTSDCWAVGQTDDDTGTSLGTLIVHWDGTSWSLGSPAPTGEPFERLNSVDCLTASDCWAVGLAGPNQPNDDFLPIFPGAPGDQGIVEHYDGSTWSVVPSLIEPAPNGGYLSAVTCVSATDCWATGSTTGGSGGVPTGTLAEHWNGSRWSVVPTPSSPLLASAILTDVTCLSSTQCWATATAALGGGNFNPVAAIEAWNGIDWSVQPSPNVTVAAFLDGVACVRGDACWSVGAAVIAAGNGLFVPLIEQMVLPQQSVQGFVAATSDGGIFNFGAFPFRGSMGGVPLDRPVAAVAATPDGNGYWEAATDGGIFSFGDAGFDGSMGGHELNEPVVGIAATPDGKGYWEVAADGGIFSFGDAGFYGSMGGTHLDQPVVGMAAAPDGRGYWEVASDGGIFAFGSARFHGSMGGIPLDRPIVGMAGHSERRWLLAGGRRRGHLHLRQRSLSRVRPGAGNPHLGAGRGHDGHARRGRLLADRRRWLDLRLRRCRLPRLAGRDPTGRPGGRRGVLSPLARRRPRGPALARQAEPRPDPRLWRTRRMTSSTTLAGRGVTPEVEGPDAVGRRLERGLADGVGGLLRLPCPRSAA